MELKPFYEVVEDAIQTLGVDPETTRCEDVGQWILEREDIEVYIDVWQPMEHNQWEYFKEEEPTAIFQVVAPVCYLPESKEERFAFMEEVLYINHHMFYGSFTVNMDEGMAAIRFKRLLEGANRVEMIEPIESISFYADNLSKYLTNKYGSKKIQKNE
ncbi:MAG: YbjN domain-containing protein [Bacteroidia bacterium]|nr:YbjN domain-containing protein [Bacteroidia bacterium]